MKKQSNLNMLSPDQIKKLNRESRKKIFEGSKSFSLASLLLSKSQRSGTHFLYRWCRFCDDEMDALAQQSNPVELKSKLAWLREETEKAVAGNTDSSDVFLGLCQVTHAYSIPSEYLYDLLEGMRMDIEKKEYCSFEELSLYCYRVAGVVGLMMCRILGVREERAYQHACDLGMAMQLSNIARDVKEDFLLGRVYLPSDWLAEEGLSRDNFLEPSNHPATFRVVSRLLDRADFWYQSGLKGVPDLPFRARFAVCSAAFIYQKIGKKVLAKRDLSNRVWVSLYAKCLLIARAFFHLTIRLGGKGVLR